MSAWRQLRAIALLPGIAAIVVPAVILLTGEGPEPGWGEGWLAALPILGGVALIAAGGGLWAWTVALFGRVGRGTLAPWDPTRRLVVEGPYRHVRNPMISGVLAVLAGEALLLGSVGIAVWAIAFAVINTIYFVASEEPGLERRFGDEYALYERNVPRWIPRRRAWLPEDDGHLA